MRYRHPKTLFGKLNMYFIPIIILAYREIAIIRGRQSFSKPCEFKDLPYTSTVFNNRDDSKKRAEFTEEEKQFHCNMSILVAVK